MLVYYSICKVNLMIDNFVISKKYDILKTFQSKHVQQLVFMLVQTQDTYLNQFGMLIRHN